MLKDYLYIGNSANASCKEGMNNLGITAILNVSNTCQNHFCSDFRYKTISVEDDGSTDLAKWFREAIQFIGMYSIQVLIENLNFCTIFGAFCH